MCASAAAQPRACTVEPRTWLATARVSLATALAWFAMARAWLAMVRACPWPGALPAAKLRVDRRETAAGALK